METPLELAQIRIGQVGEARQLTLGEIGDPALAPDELAERGNAAKAG